LVEIQEEDMKLNNIEAILFDSGRVLNVPRSGHWFIPPKFYSYVDASIFDSISTAKRNLAFSKASAYINSISEIKTTEEEYEYFKNYYEILSNELKELKLSKQNINDLAKDLVYNSEKYKFFDDALKIIPLLHIKYKLAVVSDAWPSLKDVFINAGLYSYFSSFIISSIIGVTKPNEKMYLTALDELKTSPKKAIFIDDNPRNCIGAKRLGIRAILLCRNNKYYYLQKLLGIVRGYDVIHSLYDLVS
jgi:putative hydrolase of the HAD superfamily